METYLHGSVRRVARRIEEVFSALEKVPFLRPEDRKEFRHFRRHFISACARIDQRIEEGHIKPWAKHEIETLLTCAQNHFGPRSKNTTSESSPSPLSRISVPHCHIFSRREIRVGIFIGSFDPFQMTHLETALRFICCAQRPADLVLIIPEGAYSSLKPGRSDYNYRFDLLRRQLEEVFRPFLIPLDIGHKEDTIGIVRRLLSLFRSYSVTATHVLGSDVFPLAAKWYPQDMEIWTKEARKQMITLDFGAFVVKRNPNDDIAEALSQTRKLGIPVQLDRRPIGTPSSTELRQKGVFTIIFPTPEVMEKLEVVFRYGMHRHWISKGGGPEYEI